MTTLTFKLVIALVLVFITAIIICGADWYKQIKSMKKDIYANRETIYNYIEETHPWEEKIESTLTNIVGTVDTLVDCKEKTEAAIDDIYKNLDKHRKFIKEQKEVDKSQQEINKLTTQSFATVDIALIRLIDVPFLFDQLDPGYALTWTGEIPYPINEVFVNSKIKIGNYEYNIDAIDGSNLTISRS